MITNETDQKNQGELAYEATLMVSTAAKEGFLAQRRKGAKLGPSTAGVSPCAFAREVLPKMS